MMTTVTRTYKFAHLTIKKAHSSTFRSRSPSFHDVFCSCRVCRHSTTDFHFFPSDLQSVDSNLSLW